MGTTIVFFFNTVRFITSIDNLYFGADHRLIAAGLNNPGIISKLGVTVFFMSLMMLMIERKFLFLIFCV